MNIQAKSKGIKKKKGKVFAQWNSDLKWPPLPAAAAKARGRSYKSRPAAAVICRRRGFSVARRSFSRVSRRCKLFSCRAIPRFRVWVAQSLPSRVQFAQTQLRALDRSLQVFLPPFEMNRELFAGFDNVVAAIQQALPQLRCFRVVSTPFGHHR